MKYSVVIPVYNSGAWLEELVSRLGTVLSVLAPGDFEVVLVDDASPDPATWPAVVAQAARHPWVRGFQMLYNVGQFRAILCGMEQSQGDFVITMDDDLQHPPEEIPRLVEAILAQPSVECVIGRYEAKQHAPWRNLGSATWRWVQRWLYGMPPGLHPTSFRILKRSLVQKILLFRAAAPQICPLIFRLATGVVNVAVRHEPRHRGVSGYGLFSLARITCKGIINASLLPLRLISAFGLVSAVLAFLMGTFYFVRWCMGEIAVAGYASLILAISFFSGMILLGIGILGEYVGRIVLEITGMPRYAIGQKTGV